MRKQFRYYIGFGVATALLVWSLQEFVLYIVTQYPIQRTAGITLYGLLTGLLFGAFIGGMEGFFTGSRLLFRRGAGFGGLLGLVGGAAGFYLVDQITNNVLSPESNVFVILFFQAIRWFVLALCVGISLGIRDKSYLSMIRGIIAGAASGILAGLFFSAIAYYTRQPFLARVLGILILTTAMAGLLFQVSQLGRKMWLKALNGRLEGIDIELHKEIYFLGTQDSDDINLKDYQNVQQSHAKLIRYFDNYSLVDNDPFCQTFVNFRGIKEQFLKNGDILKVGTALFQYNIVD